MRQTSKKPNLRVVKNTLGNQSNSKKVLIDKLEVIESDMKDMLDKINVETSKNSKTN